MSQIEQSATDYRDDPALKWAKESLDLDSMGDESVIELRRQQALACVQTIDARIYNIYYDTPASEVFRLNRRIWEQVNCVGFNFLCLANNNVNIMVTGEEPADRGDVTLILIVLNQRNAEDFSYEFKKVDKVMHFSKYLFIESEAETYGLRYQEAETAENMKSKIDDAFEAYPLWASGRRINKSASVLTQKKLVKMFQNPDFVDQISALFIANLEK